MQGWGDDDALPASTPEDERFASVPDALIL